MVRKVVGESTFELLLNKFEDEINSTEVQALGVQVLQIWRFQKFATFVYMNKLNLCKLTQAICARIRALTLTQVVAYDSVKNFLIYLLAQATKNFSFSSAN